MKEIAFVTDIHLDETYPASHGVDARKNWDLILQDITSKKIQEIIFGGDIGNVSSNEWFFRSLKGFEINLILGNHDCLSEIRKYYKVDYLENQKENNELFYTKEDEFFKYLFLDSSSANLSSTQLDWLKKELLTDKKVLLFIHHPVLTIDSVVDRKYPLLNREKLKTLLLEYKKEVIIICGHYHTSDVKVEENIRQLITLAGSYQIKQHTAETEVVTSTFGYRIITLKNNQVETEMILFSN